MVKEHLNGYGVMVVNMNMRGNNEGNINQYLSDTIASVFDHIVTVDVDGSTNRELYASSNADMVKTLENNANETGQSDLRDMMLHVADTSRVYEAGDYIMTDDKAPVELLGMQVIDQLIQGEVAYYKDIFEKDGINGLLESL